VLRSALEAKHIAGLADLAKESHTGLQAAKYFRALTSQAVKGAPEDRRAVGGVLTIRIANLAALEKEFASSAV